LVKQSVEDTLNTLLDQESAELTNAAIAVNQDGFREVVGAAEGMKDDKEGWKGFFCKEIARMLKAIHCVSFLALYLSNLYFLSMSYMRIELSK